MKGIIFTEFLELVEDQFGLEMVERIIAQSDLESEGSYTAVGTYDHNEIVQLVSNLSSNVNVPVNDLLVIYGEYLFGTFLKSYGHFIKEAENTFEFLGSVERYIHVEVKKLYADAELPSFDPTENGNVLELLYKSPRKLSAVAEGIIKGALKHYKEEGTIKRDFINEDGSEVNIVVTKTS